MFLLLSGQVVAQKPEIQVSFKVNSSDENLFYLNFQSKITEIETKALPILIEGLSEYIGFAKFTTNSSANKLEITLSPDYSSKSSFVQEFYLFFKLTDVDDEHQWKFLDHNEFELECNTVNDVLVKLEEDWNTYLRKSYNLELVNVLFDEVAIPLPDDSHYYEDSAAGINEAILPFKKESLKLDTDRTEFRIVFKVKAVTTGLVSTKNQKDLRASGIVDSIMTGTSTVPQNLEGCIRIELGSVSGVFLNGKVFVTDYKRKVYRPVANSNDFIDSNPE